MINFITQHWIAVVIYLIGCILAWGKLNSEMRTYGWGEAISIICLSLFSWLAFIIGTAWHVKGTRFFKWLPILLLCMVGCEPTGNYQYHYPVINSKNYARLDGNRRHAATQLPLGICYFRVWNGQDFEDSCNKWQVGDTLYMGKDPLDTLK